MEQEAKENLQAILNQPDFNSTI
jgi:hypothetical protein